MLKFEYSNIWNTTSPKGNKSYVPRESFIGLDYYLNSYFRIFYKEELFWDYESEYFRTVGFAMGLSRWFKTGCRTHYRLDDSSDMIAVIPRTDGNFKFVVEPDESDPHYRKSLILSREELYSAYADFAHDLNKNINQQLQFEGGDYDLGLYFDDEARAEEYKVFVNEEVGKTPRQTLYQQVLSRQGDLVKDQPQPPLLEYPEMQIDGDQQLDIFRERFSEPLTTEGFYGYLELLNDMSEKQKLACTKKLLQSYDISYVLTERRYDFDAWPAPFLPLDMSRALAFESYNLNEIRLGICLLGLHKDRDSLDKLTLFEKYDRLFIHAHSAKKRINPAPNRFLMQQAMKAEPRWDKIHLVEQMYDVQDKEIREWMLLNGYKNDVHHGYLLGLCMTEGRLHFKLDDIPTLAPYKTSIRDYLTSLLIGLYGIDIDDQKYAAEVVNAYLSLLQQQGLEEPDLEIIRTFRRWFEVSRYWENMDILSGWRDDALRESIRTRLADLLD